MKIGNFMIHRLLLLKINRIKSLTYMRSKHVLNVVPSPEEHLNSGKISTLFVPGRYGGMIYQAVKPLIDVPFIVKNAQKIADSYRLRGLSSNLDKMIAVLEKWSAQSEKFSEIVAEERKLTAALDELRIANATLEYDQLKPKHEIIISRLKEEKEVLLDLDDVVMPFLQTIPNFVDPTASVDKDAVDVILRHETDKEYLSHSAIGQKMGLLEFSTASPTAYYLSGKLAELELALQSYFCDKLNILGYSPLSGPDFCKSFVIEAVGGDSHSPNDCIPIASKNQRKLQQKLNLVGGASFESLLSYFINISIDKSTLPAKYYAYGRRYDPRHHSSTHTSLFTVVQTNNIHFIVLCEPEFESSEFDTTFNQILKLYKNLAAPFRVRTVQATNLNPTESLRKRIELWSPALKDYVEVSHVSQRNDFVSKRCHVNYGVECHVEGYCSIVEGVAVNIPVLIGCLVEQFQRGENHVDFDSVFDVLNWHI